MAVNNTYYADDFAQPGPAWVSPSVSITRSFRFTIANQPLLVTNVGFSVNDIIKLCPLSQGQLIELEEYFIYVPELDTGSAVVESLGDDGGASAGTTNAAIYQTGAVAGRGAASYLTPLGQFTTATWASSAVGGSIPAVYQGAPPKQVYVTDTGGGAPVGAGGYVGNAPLNLILKITTAPTTGTTTGVLKGWVRFHACGPYPLV
jgi:hypothetical protein